MGCLCETLREQPRLQRHPPDHHLRRLPCIGRGLPILCLGTDRFLATDPACAGEHVHRPSYRWQSFVLLFQYRGSDRRQRNLEHLGSRRLERAGQDREECRDLVCLDCRLQRRTGVSARYIPTPPKIGDGIVALVRALAESVGPALHSGSHTYHFALLRPCAVKAQTAMATPERHPIQQPHEQEIKNKGGLGHAGVLGIATRARGKFVGDRRDLTF